MRDRSRNRVRGAAERPSARVAESQTSVAGSGMAATAFLVPLVLYAAVVLYKAWVCDDAYITFRTVDNFIHGFGLRWNLGERVQSYTHPLWMFTVAGPAWLTREFYYTTIVLGFVVSLTAVTVLARSIAVSPVSACFGVAILALSRAFTDYSTSGLENPLTHLLLALFSVFYFRPATGRGERRVLFILVGLILCNRTDAGLLVLPAAAYVIFKHSGRGIWQDAAIGMLPFVAWEVFSIIYYGFPFPNTAYAKLNTGFGGVELAREGLHYAANSLQLDPITLGVTALGVAVPLVKRDGRGSAMSAGILLYLFYLMRIGGDFMGGRLFTPGLFAAVVLLARTPMRIRPAGAFLAGAALLEFAVPHLTHKVLPAGAPFQIALDENAIADERVFYAPAASLRLRRGITPWPAPESASEARGLKREWAVDRLLAVLRRTQIVSPEERWNLPTAGQRIQPVAVRGAIGFLGYYAGRDLHILDFHGLADPLLARLPAEREDPLLPLFFPHLAHKKWRIGHYLRRVPYGYLGTLVFNANLIADRDLARYYDHIALVTRGPLFDTRRWRAIWDLNTGQYDRYLESYVRRRPAPAKPGSTGAE